MKNFSEISLLKFIFVILGLIGCLTIYSAYSDAGGELSPFATKQFLWLIFAIIFMQFFSILRFSQLCFFNPLFSIISLVLLLLVLLFGENINGMRGWFKFGEFMFQPSEFVKPFFILALTNTIGRKRELILSLCLSFAFVSLLILEPDYGGALIYLFIVFVFFYLRTDRIYKFFFSILGFSVIFIFLILKKTYIVKRFLAFVDPFIDPYGAGWHSLQFKYTIARGGLFGSGWGNCLWANSYLPLPHSDSSFATLAEASGLLGTMPLMFFFSILPYIAIHFANKQRNLENAIFILLAFSAISFQAFVHIMV
ncbi:MAG TPA: FtsW/RodA/SpoVE family cell cycle protein, partial [Victivallales bacterium]|nr:FtsW/RodA/SpoVE family cell cycle protein [Victivallales bacterium]